MQQRKDEILAKKAKLAEIKRQRELRQKEFTTSRQSLGDASDLSTSRRSRLDNKDELDSLISSLVGEGRSKSIDPASPPIASRGASQPTSHASLPQSDVETSDAPPASPPSASKSRSQNLSYAPFTTIYEVKSEATKRELLTYSKGVQTSGAWTGDASEYFGESDGEENRRPGPRRLSRRQRERDEELRQNIRKEIEEELRAVQDPVTEDLTVEGGIKQNKFPARALNDEELNAVTSSSEFLDFIDRSSKVIERALDEQYDVLADYRMGGNYELDDEEDEFGGEGRRGRRVRELLQFYDERWCRKRMISDISFSPKFPELVLSAYTKNPSAPHDPDGLIQIWNLHMQARPEYTFHAQSDILTAKFSPYHPNLILGGSYSGQVLLWDTRSKSSAPVQKTPLTGTSRGAGGHTHPIYSLQVVGTQNAHNVISASTDGAVCSWNIDMLTQPQEHIMLTTPHPSRSADDLAPTCIAFPQADPTYFLAGSEEGTIHLCHRYDRAGAKAGVDVRVSYSGHAAPVMSLDFHRSNGPMDLGDLVLSAGLDWSVKLWRVKTPASSTNISLLSGAARRDIGPILDIPREDLVYDVKWSPAKPGVFGLVDGAGNFEVWDLNSEVEVPVAKATPSQRTDGVGLGARSLNKLAWEPNEGRRVAVGGLDGVVTLFEIGGELSGADAKGEEWNRMKRLVSRLDGRGVNS